MSESVQATHAHDFDFYVGTWMIHNWRLRKALAGCTEWYEFEAISEARPVLGGIGNFDEFDAPSEGISGLTLRVFDPSRDEWSLYRASSRGGPLGDPRSAGSTATEDSSLQTMSSRAGKSESSSSGRRSPLPPHIGTRPSR